MSAAGPLAGAAALLVEGEPPARGLGAALEAAGLRVARVAPAAGPDEDDRAALARLGGALAKVAADEGIDAERVAVVGCGPAAVAAFLLACRAEGIAALVLLQPTLVRARLDAARPFQPLEMALNLGCPVQLQYGARGAERVPEEVELARAALSQSARTFDIVVHPEAGDRFHDAGDGGPAAAAAHERALAFLREHLAP